MILSVSRRTDIPSFHGKWFLNRLKAGEVYTRNPMNYKQVSRIILNPDTVECIVYWTKNAIPFMKYLEEIEDLGYDKYYFLYTITGYESDIEKNLPSLEKRIKNFKEISSRVGPDRIIWRYDPVLVNEKYDLDFHKEIFDSLARELSPYTKKIIFSYIDVYRKIEKDFREVSIDEKLKLALIFKEVAEKYNIKIQTCKDEVPFIEKGGCIESELVSKILNSNVKVKRDTGQRPSCKCVKSVDIGSYNTCSNGCTYCYANKSKEPNLSICDPLSPLLCDSIRGDENIYDRKIEIIKNAAK